MSWQPPPPPPRQGPPPPGNHGFVPPPPRSNPARTPSAPSMMPPPPPPHSLPSMPQVQTHVQTHVQTQFQPPPPPVMPSQLPTMPNIAPPPKMGAPTPPPMRPQAYQPPQAQPQPPSLPPPHNFQGNNAMPPPPPTIAARPAPPAPPGAMVPPMVPPSPPNPYAQQHQQQHQYRPPPTPMANSHPPKQSPYPPPQSPRRPPPTPSKHPLSPGVAQAPRIMDPDQIPTAQPPSRPHAPTLEMYYPKAHLIHGDFGRLMEPPPADSRFLVLDDGNASPHTMRSTMYSIPKDGGILRQTGPVDMAVLSTPLALPGQEFAGTVGQADHLPESGRLGIVALEQTTKPTAPPRCARCSAYANVFWDTSGRLCNFCGYRNHHIPRTMGHNVGTVDYKVSGPYVTRPADKGPVQPHVIYAVDVTAPNAMTYLHILLHQVLPVWAQQQALHQEAYKSSFQHTRAGIALVGCTGVYIPNCDGSGFAVMPDVKEEPFSPLPLQAWTWNLATEFNAMQATWDGLLNHDMGLVPQLIQEIGQTKIPSRTAPLAGYSLTCGGAAMEFLVDALQQTGGRAVWISWRRPNYGKGAIPDREAHSKDHAYPEMEALLYTALQASRPLVKLADNLAAADFYDKLSQRCAENQVAMDVVLHTDPTVPGSFLDVATLSKVCQVSNGRFSWISTKEEWAEQFVSALIRPLQFTGWDAVLKVRCSNGLRVRSIQSNVGVHRKAASLSDDAPELELAVVTPETTIGVWLEHRVGGLPKEAKHAFVQSALLYTNPWNGERRVRVSTLALRVAATPNAAFRSIDFGTVAALQLREVAINLRPEESTDGNIPLTKAKNQLLEHCVSILHGYRKNGSDKLLPQSQLVLPDKLQLFPLFCLSLFKSPLLRSSLPRRTGGLQSALPSPRADERAFFMHHASLSSSAMAFWMVHPMVVDLKLRLGWRRPGATLTDEANTVEFLKHSPYVELPDPLQPTVSTLSDGKIYLMDTCFAFYVLIGKDVPADEVDRVLAALEEDSDHAVVRALKQLRVWSQPGKEPRWLRPVNAPVVVVRHDDALYQSCLKWMVCDAAFGERNYLDFLCELHRLVMAKLES